MASIILSDNYGSSQVRKQPIKACTHALQILRYLYLPCISKNRRKFAKKIRFEKLDSQCMKIWIFLWKFENFILTFAAIWVFYFFRFRNEQMHWMIIFVSGFDWAQLLNCFFARKEMCTCTWLKETQFFPFQKKCNKAGWREEEKTSSSIFNDTVN